jgi:hypothetical protein
MSALLALLSTPSSSYKDARAGLQSLLPHKRWLRQISAFEKDFKGCVLVLSCLVGQAIMNMGCLASSRAAMAKYRMESQAVMLSRGCWHF